MQEICEGLFLGPETAACDWSLLQSQGVTHVLVAGSELTPHFPGQLVYLVLPLEDTVEQSLVMYLPQACEYIHQARMGGGRVLVHCRAGVSRSASIVLAYIMQTHQLRLQTALTTIQAKRPCAHPNPRFLNELKRWENSLFPSIFPPNSYFCLNCRQILFTELHFHPHSTDLNPNLDQCRHIFLLDLEETAVKLREKTLFCSVCDKEIGDLELFCYCGKAVLP